MCCKSRIVSSIFVIIYLVMCYFVFFTNLMDMNNMMIAMKIMGAGMLVESIINTYTNFRDQGKKNCDMKNMNKK